MKRNSSLRSGTCTFKITTTTTKLAGLRGLTNWYIAECLFARHCVTNATVNVVLSIEFSYIYRQKGGLVLLMKVDHNLPGGGIY